MAWLDVHFLTDEFEENRDGSSRGKKTFYAESDSVTALDGFLAATLGGVSIPAMGEAFSASHPRCKAKTRTPRRITSKKAEVEITYEDPSPNGFVLAEELLELPAEIEETYEVITEEYAVDFTPEDDDGPKPVRNSAGETFDRMPERFVSLKVITIKKYVDAEDKAAIEELINTNNDDEVEIAGSTYEADELWLASAAFTLADDDIWHATYVAKRHFNKWKDLVVDAGYSQILSGFPDGGKREMIMEQDPDGNKFQVAKPWPLDGDGVALTNGNSDPVTLEFRPYPPADWSGLPVE